MQIVIDMPEELYDRLIIKGKDISEEETSTILDIIADGTVLPKGHGRIADIDKVLEEMRATRTYDIPFTLERVKPIIEADKEVDL